MSSGDTPRVGAHGLVFNSGLSSMLVGPPLEVGCTHWLTLVPQAVWDQHG